MLFRFQIQVTWPVFSFPISNQVTSWNEGWPDSMRRALSLRRELAQCFRSTQVTAFKVQGTSRPDHGITVLKQTDVINTGLQASARCLGATLCGWEIRGVGLGFGNSWQPVCDVKTVVLWKNSEVLPSSGHSEIHSLAPEVAKIFQKKGNPRQGEEGKQRCWSLLFLCKDWVKHT